jgi:hypothetical protein
MNIAKPAAGGGFTVKLMKLKLQGLSLARHWEES